MKRLFIGIIFLSFTLITTACGKEPRIFFTEPGNEATVDSPFLVRWSSENFVIEPGGEDREGAGHAHIVINDDCVRPGRPVPANDTHIHYAEGELEAHLDLFPGTYELCLVGGNGIHVALDGDGMQDRITVHVENYTAPLVRFSQPSYGDTVEGTVRVVAEVENVDLEAAGYHLHVLINTDCVIGGQRIPEGENYVHLDEGETEAALDLPAGAHTLCLQLGDEDEIALSNRGARDTINVIVR